MFFILFTTGSGKSLTFEIAPVLNNEAAQLYTGVTFSGSYAKSGGKKTGRKGGHCRVPYKIYIKMSYW